MDSHQEVYFMGRIAAATTHELKNILAIIKETLGLLEDLLTFSSGEEVSIEQYQQWLRKALNTVTDQVARGISLVQYFNRFAHIPDHPVLQINVRNSIQHLITLCAHLIRLKQVKIEQDGSPEGADIPLVTCPLYFYMVIFAVLDRLMNQLPAGSNVVVRADSVENNNVAVSFKILIPEGKSPKDSIFEPASFSIELLLDSIGAGLSFDEDNGIIKLLFHDLDPDEFVSRYFNKA